MSRLSIGVALVAIGVTAAGCQKARTNDQVPVGETGGTAGVGGAAGASAQATGGADPKQSTASVQLPSAASKDTIIGTVTEVGADPATWMSLLPAAGGQSLRVSGAGVAGLRNVSGAYVWVSGAREAGGFRVDAFEVRRMNNQPVDDGVVIVEQGNVGIRMRSGTRRAVPDAPPALRDLAGARVWISQPVPNQQPSYGVIVRP